MKTKLSLLWVFVLLNNLFKDIHDLFRPGLLEEIQNGVVNGNRITEEIMLIGGVLIELPMIMVVLPQFLRPITNKWTNIVMALVAAIILAGNPPKDLDDYFFLIVSGLALVAIVLLSLRIKKPAVTGR